ncbi:MAG: hypothetical protein WD426_09870 [Anditalea sp.]
MDQLGIVPKQTRAFARIMVFVHRELPYVDANALSGLVTKVTLEIKSRLLRPNVCLGFSLRTSMFEITIQYLDKS